MSLNPREGVRVHNAIVRRLNRKEIRENRVNEIRERCPLHWRTQRVVVNFHRPGRRARTLVCSGGRAAAGFFVKL